MNQPPWQPLLWTVALLATTWGFGIASSLFAALVPRGLLAVLAPLLVAAPYFLAWSLMSLPRVSRALLAFVVSMLVIVAAVSLGFFLTLVTAPSLMNDTRVLSPIGMAGIMLAFGLVIGCAFWAGHAAAWAPARRPGWARLHIGAALLGALAVAAVSLAAPGQPFFGAGNLPLGSFIAIAVYFAHGLGTAMMLAKGGALPLRWIPPAIALALAGAVILLRS